MRVRRGQSLLDAGPAANIPQTHPYQWKEAGNDQEKLQNLVVNGARETAQEDITQHDNRRNYDREVKDPRDRQSEMEKGAIEDMQRLDESRHRIHGDAGRKNGHHGKGAGIENASLVVVTHAQEFGHRARL